MASSKMSWRETCAKRRAFARLYWAAFVVRIAFSLPHLLPPILDAELPLEDPQGWDTTGPVARKKVGASIPLSPASIAGSLSGAISTISFTNISLPGAQLLHAGCGSGQVDSELSREMRITAVDISLPALESYRRNNPGAEAVRHGDILHLDDVAGGALMGHITLAWSNILLRTRSSRFCARWVAP